VASTRAIRLVRPRRLALLFAVAAACSGVSPPNDGLDEGSGDDGSGDGDGDTTDGAAPPYPFQCEIADDCVAASSTCCECPSFAVPLDSEFAGACDQVECEPPLDCPKVEPACVDTQCELVCTSLPVTVKDDCPLGFARDAFGCLLDECRTDAVDEVFACQEDVDCTQVPADCCGCERGGAQTAVAASAADEFAESLECQENPPCPGVNVCDPGLVPRCIAQTCTLAPGDDDDGGDDAGDDGGDGDGDGSGGVGAFCGVPDFPPCPPGQMCVLNHPDAGDATRMGLGTCR
jgi:hypothetical protein